MADLGSALQSVLQVPGLQELLNQSITEQRQAMPLRTAVRQQAVNMLPNSAFTRPDMAAIPQANYSTPAPSSSGPDWAKILGLLAAGVGGGGLLAKLLSGGGGGTPGGASGNLANIVNGLKKLFSHGGTGPVAGTTLPPDYWNNTGAAGNVERNTPVDWSSLFGPGANLPSDPGFYVGGGQVTDPSGGTGVGPGMQSYYNNLGGPGDPGEE